MTEAFGSIEEGVTALIARHLGVHRSRITNSACLFDDLHADELSGVELVAALEQAFGCEIPDEVADELTTRGQLVSFIAARRAELPPAGGRLNGKVKWFDPVNGYGFIQVDGGPALVVVQSAEVERAGLRGLREEQQLIFSVVQAEGKLVATDLTAN